MHFHHKHDVGGCTDDHDWPDWAVAILATLDRRELQLMTALQDSIDAYATQFATALAAISAEIDTLKASAEPSADLSGLDAALAQAQALVPAPAEQPQPEPVVTTDPAPADQPVDVPADPNQAASIPSVPLA